jgi:hypothetical protein
VLSNSEQVVQAYRQHMLHVNSAVRIIIPNGDLVVPDRSSNGKGEIYPSDTRVVLRINAWQDINYRSLPKPGRYFLSLVHVLYHVGAQHGSIRRLQVVITMLVLSHTSPILEAG